MIQPEPPISDIEELFSEILSSQSDYMLEQISQRLNELITSRHTRQQLYARSLFTCLLGPSLIRELWILDMLKSCTRQALVRKRWGKTDASSNIEAE